MMGEHHVCKLKKKQYGGKFQHTCIFMMGLTEWVQALGYQSRINIGHCKHFVPEKESCQY